MTNYKNTAKSNQKAFELSNTVQSQLAFSLDKNGPILQTVTSKSRFIGSIVISILSLCIFGLITYNAYRYNKIPSSLDNTLLIKRDIAPLRIIPTEIGGEQFSNQDKLIYNNFEDQKINDWKKKVIKEDKKKDADNPLLEAASKEILDTSGAKTNQTEFENKKLPVDTKADNKQKQTKIINTQKQTAPKKEQKKSIGSSVFDVLE